MTPLIRIEGRAISLPEADIDTDIIYPARFLLIIEKRGLGRYAFHDRRGDPTFPIGQAVEGVSPFLIAGPNFGCGSSREQAPWALADLGFRVIVAPSFGEIFRSNCIKNGMLPIELPEATAELDIAAARGDRFQLDLEACSLRIGREEPLIFAIDEDSRQSLLNGWDEIGRIRAQHAGDIRAFETTQRLTAPWLWLDEERG